MTHKDPRDAAMRRAVTERLRRFFAELTAQLAAGRAEIWAKVERRLTQKAQPDTGHEGPANVSPAQSQPLQPHRSEAQSEDER
jgi:hypothetical protein